MASTVDTAAAPPAKKLKTGPPATGTPLYSDLDLSKLAFDATPQGNEIKHASVKYDGQRLAFQLEDVAAGSLRAPFGIDDGSKFAGKPSLKIELREPQRAFFQDVIETKVKEAAVKHKATWFGALKPPPEDDAVRASFNSRVHQDEDKNYPPGLKVNVNLTDDKKPKVNVLTTRRLDNGKITKPVPLSPEDVARRCSVVPVLCTAGGVWIFVNAKMQTFKYGLVFEASDVLVIEEAAASSAFNLGGVEVANEEEQADEQAGGGGDALGGAFGQFEG